MEYDLILLGALTGLSLLCLAAVLQVRWMRRINQAQALLHHAKREALEISQLSLRNPYPLIQLSKAGELLFANPAALERFEELRTLGKNHPVLSGLDAIMREGRETTREITFRDVVYHQSITPARAHDDDAVIIYCYDITERKQYEYDLKEAHKLTEKARIEAEKANQARGDFLANMSHELRTPMNGIIGLSELLTQSDMTEENRELAEAVNSSARGLLILLNDILDFSKIEAGELGIETVSFDLRRLVDQIERLQKSVASGKGLVLQTNVADNVPACLLGDPGRLGQILNNLINNALKFTQEGSVRVLIDGALDGKGNFITRIAVRDTGIGIPKDKQQKIFAKFQQADSSTARHYGGTGLGLAITSDLVRLMGGKIALQSEPGKGSTFIITLPFKIGTAQNAVGTDEKSGVPERGVNLSGKILIVDDHPVNLLFLRRTLEKLGFENFDEARSGRKALDLYNTNRYDLILMDCQMPDMDGFETSRRIRALPVSKTPPVIIAVTADAMKGAREKCERAGMDDYISKPVEQAKLLEILRRWLPGEFGHMPGPDKKAAFEKTDLPSSKSSVLPVFDWTVLGAFTDGDKAAEHELITLFLENLELDFKTLDQAFCAGDYEAWDAAAHKISGACSNLGARALATICDRAQNLKPHEEKAIPSIHALILKEYKRVKNELLAREAA